MTAVGLAVVAAAALAILGEERGPRWLVYVWKPAATLLILLTAAFLPGAGAGAGYRALIVAGLACSVAGDVFLMLPRDRFVMGLASFLVAHLAYSAAFWPPGGGLAVVLGLVLLLAIGGVVLAVLWPGLPPRLRLPVTAYVGVIIVMVWLAGARWASEGTEAALAAAVGAVLFMGSDTLLALDRFRRRIPHARLWVLATYYAGQYLIARSVGGASGG